MGFSSRHRIRFQDTDAAGVVYFANGLSLCHTAYEDSLQAVGLNLTDFFGSTAQVAYPIVHASMDYRRPMRCGDMVTIRLAPQRLDHSSFKIEYCLYSDAVPPVLLAQALTRHICIHPQSRTRLTLPTPMEHWLQYWAAEQASTDY
jgi:1,4-dihydroxy-2-naphthoyl-CoA hydrolase